MTIRFYAADLAAYNSGRLYGVWIDATSDIEEMQQAVSAMLRKSPCPNVTVYCPECSGVGESFPGVTCRECNGRGEVPSAEEWVIHDYDDDLGAIRHLGETSDLARIAGIMSAVEELEAEYSAAELQHLLAWVSDRGDDPDTWVDVIQEAYAGTWSDPEDYAADYCDSAGYMSEAPDFLARYVDFRAMARDFALGGDMDFICLATGRHLQSYDDMRGRECIALHCH